MKQMHQSGKEKRAEEKKHLTGTIRTTGKGMGFVEVDGHEEDIVVEPEFLNHAFNGDTVEIILAGEYRDAKRGRLRLGTDTTLSKPRQAGQVIKIIERAKKQFVGLLVNKEGNIWLMPDDRKMYVPIVVPDPKPEQMGKKVLVKITHWEKSAQYPTGEVVQVLGEKGDHETEIQSIILDRGIDTNFPPEVDAEAHALEKSEKPLPAEEIAKRKDFRNTLTFTIDPADAKDFDDALSLKEIGNGLYEIGVHIADVSYYVRPGTNLDREAIKRATSIYMVDRTIPMLPEVLSNDLCSLNPNEDKFAFSAVFVMDMQGIVKERWFGRTVINSDKRFSYEDAQESLNTKGEHFESLHTLNEIAGKLREEKYKEGAIDFETEEVKFKLDEHGKPIEVIKKQRLDTHKLIEEYMLLANKEVAEYIFNHQKQKATGASIYRIHDVPDEERIQDLALFLQALGHTLPVRQGKVSSQDINKLLKSIQGTPEEGLIKTATIRSMAKAIYSTKNIGHFGLAFKFYTHFTSPIRRYPDLVVHRILDSILKGDQKAAKDEFRSLEKIAAHSTEREIAAAEAERASIKYKQVEYMSERIGEEFDGIISGVTEWGLYIEEINTKCEGMVPIRELGNDYYIFNKKTYSIKGEKTKKEFRLGDKVRFRVVKADLDAKTLDYALSESK
ncbi:ribonuclease R [Candidatus Parcubacteria bacterium]|nr:ribonuclease R [Candidatus Parcubacteria bacterium]